MFYLKYVSVALAFLIWVLAQLAPISPALADDLTGHGNAGMMLPGKSYYIEGTGLSGVTSVKYGGVNVKSFNIVSDSRIDFVPDDCQPAGFLTLETATQTFTDRYKVYTAPVSPLLDVDSLTGALVIHGCNLSSVELSSIRLNSEEIPVSDVHVGHFPGFIGTSYWLNSIPNGLSSGQITLRFFGVGDVTVLGRVEVPTTIVGISPTHGPVGSEVHLFGQNFKNVRSVVIGKTQVPFEVLSSSELIVHSPNTESDATFTVTDDMGTQISSSGKFTTDKPPVISDFEPRVGLPGSTVVIKGSNLSASTSATVQGKAADFKVIDSSTLQITVPPFARSGNIVIQSPGGLATSAQMFSVKPASLTGTNVSLSTEGVLSVTWTGSLGGTVGENYYGVRVTLLSDGVPVSVQHIPAAITKANFGPLSGNHTYAAELCGEYEELVGDCLISEKLPYALKSTHTSTTPSEPTQQMPKATIESADTFFPVRDGYEDFLTIKTNGLDAIGQTITSPGTLTISLGTLKKVIPLTSGAEQSIKWNGLFGNKAAFGTASLQVEFKVGSQTITTSRPVIIDKRKLVSQTKTFALKASQVSQYCEDSFGSFDCFFNKGEMFMPAYSSANFSYQIELPESGDSTVSYTVNPKIKWSKTAFTYGKTLASSTSTLSHGQVIGPKLVGPSKKLKTIGALLDWDMFCPRNGEVILTGFEVKATFKSLK